MPQAVYGARYAVSLEGLVINSLSSTVPFLSRTLVYSGVMSALGRVQYKLAKNPLFLPESFTSYYNVGFDRHLTREKLDEVFDEMFESIRAIKRFVESNNANCPLVLVAGRDAFAKDASAEGPQAIAKSVELGISHLDTLPLS